MSLPDLSEHRGVFPEEYQQVRFSFLQNSTTSFLKIKKKADGRLRPSATWCGWG
jgi:hypothetical protein